MRASHAPVVIFSLAQIPEIFEMFDTWARCGAGKRVVGSYKGEKEQSYMLPASDFYVRGLPEVCARHEQESVLYLDGQRGAWLRFAPEYGESGQKYLGQWREVPEAVAASRDAWTYDPQSGRFYVAG